MARQKMTEELGEVPAVLKPVYKINPEIRKTGFVANYFRLGYGIIVIHKDRYARDADPLTGQEVLVLDKPAKVFIDGIERPTFDIPAELPMKVIYSLGQAKVILCDKEQAIEYNAFAKRLHNGEIK